MSENAADTRSWTGWFFAVIGVILALVYLSNPFAGVGEFLPDIIPGIGNLDEVIATTILISCLARLGIRITPQVPSRPTTVDVAPNLPSPKDASTK